MLILTVFICQLVIIESRFKRMINTQKLMKITAANSELIAFKLIALESMTRLQLITYFMVS